MSTKIAKNCANHDTRRLLQIHFGLEAAQFSKFNLDDSTMEREVDFILSLPLCLGTQPVNLAQLNLFKSPMFPNITVMRNDMTRLTPSQGSYEGRMTTTIITSLD